MDGKRSDAEVGALVIAATVIFVGAVIAVNRARYAADTYPLFINLPHMAGVDAGDEVVYQGYKAGVVDQIKITYEPRLRFNVRMKIKGEIRLRQGAVVTVRNRGIGGATYLELTSPDEGRPIEDAETLPAILDPDLMFKANEVMGDTRSLLHTLQKEGTAADLSLAVKRLNHVLDTLDRTLADVDAVVKEDRAPLKVAVEHASGIAAKSDELLAKRQAEIDKSLESLKHLPAIMTELEGFVTEIKRHPWRLVRKGDPPPEKPKKP